MPAIPENVEPRTGLSMGEHMALTAAQWGITREAQDELAAASHQHLAAAYERGFFDDLVTPYLGVSRDTNLRADSTVEKLSTLKPVFGKGDGATMTAGNSTPLTDGASAVLLGQRGVGGGAPADPARAGSSTPRPRPSTTSTVTRACSWRPRTPFRACSPETA